jgi:DHA1 family multidrug resistance protein-like MFS transporter
LGQILRYVTGNRLFKYPEELPDFHIPYDRLTQQQKLAEINKEIDVESETPTPAAVEEAEEMERTVTAEDQDDNVDVEKRATHQSRAGLENLTSVKSLSRTQTIPYTRERFEVDQILNAQKTLSLPIQPMITSTGQVLVTWYTTDDQDNPHNWSQKKKSYVSFLIW